MAQHICLARKCSKCFFNLYFSVDFSGLNYQVWFLLSGRCTGNPPLFCFVLFKELWMVCGYTFHAWVPPALSIHSSLSLSLTRMMCSDKTLLSTRPKQSGNGSTHSCERDYFLCGVLEACWTTWDTSTKPHQKRIMMQLSKLSPHSWMLWGGVIVCLSTGVN